MAWIGKCIDSRHHEPSKFLLKTIILLMVGERKMMPRQMPRSGYVASVA